MWWKRCELSTFRNRLNYADESVKTINIHIFAACGVINRYRNSSLEKLTRAFNEIFKWFCLLCIHFIKSRAPYQMDHFNVRFRWMRQVSVSLREKFYDLSKITCLEGCSLLDYIIDFGSVARRNVSNHTNFQNFQIAIFTTYSVHTEYLYVFRWSNEIVYLAHTHTHTVLQNPEGLFLGRKKRNKTVILVQPNIDMQVTWWTYLGVSHVHIVNKEVVGIEHKSNSTC